MALGCRRDPGLDKGRVEVEKDCRRDSCRCLLRLGGLVGRRNCRSCKPESLVDLHHMLHNHCLWVRLLAGLIQHLDTRCHSVAPSSCANGSSSSDKHWTPAQIAAGLMRRMHHIEQ